MTIYDRLIEVIPGQFQGQVKLNSILKAAGTQLDELTAVFSDIKNGTTIDNSSGETLDLIGTNVALTRADAFRLLGYPAGIAIDDELYRRCLKFKILLNNTDSSYKDIKKGIEYLWGNVKTEYSESPDAPAQFTIILEDSDIDLDDPYATLPMVIHAAGVRAIIFNHFVGSMDLVDYERFTDETVSYYNNLRYDGKYMYNGAWKYKPEFEEEAL